MSTMLIVAIIIALLFGLKFLYASVALFALLSFFTFVSFILLLFGWSKGAVVALWAIYFGVMVLWNYVHGKEERERREQSSS